MVTREEIQEMIDMAIEKATPIITEKVLLLLPEVMGNLMANYAAGAEINKKFYSDHPEFKNNRDSVQSVVEMTEGKDPLAKHEDILKRAVPEIRKRIETVGKMNMETISANPSRQFEKIEAPSDQVFNDPNGVI